MVKDIKLFSRLKAFQLFAILILSLLLITLPPSVYPAYADAVNAKVSAEDQTVHRGQTFEVDVELTENTGLLTLYLIVKFDHSVFTLTNVQQIRQALGELNMEHSGSGYDYVDEKTGGFNIFWDGSKADRSNGKIVRLTFESSMNAALGTYPIEIVVDQKNTTVSYGVQANVVATSPQITLIEGAYIVVWHDWNGISVDNENIEGHPFNDATGGYEYSSEESLDFRRDFPSNPIRPDDEMYSYEFEGWEGAVWRGDVPGDSSVIYYVAKYKRTPKTYTVWYYVDGIGADNEPDGVATEDELYTAKNTDYDAIIDDMDIPYKADYTFYGWYTDQNFTRRLVSPLMPAQDVKLYGYLKYNIRETDVPVIQLVYRETVTDGNLDEIAYVDVNITRNYGLSSLMITLSEYDKENFTFCGFEKGEIFKQMSFFTTNYENDVYPDNFNFSWNNSSLNSYETGHLLVLKFKVNGSSSPGAYEVKMTANEQNTTYVKDDEIWYSRVEFANTKIPIGKTNRWVVPVPSTETVVEVESETYVPYNVELVVRLVDTDVVIDDDALQEILEQNLTVYSVFEIYFEQNSTRLTQERYTELFGTEKVKVKIKLTTLQKSCKKLDIYYVDDQGLLELYESENKEGYLIFETNHFSNWALIGDFAAVNAETWATQILRILLILFGISASALISILFVKNRKNHAVDANSK